MAGDFAKATGLDGLWNSGIVRGIRQWADQNQGLSKPLFALGGALLATRLFIGDGMKGIFGDGMTAKIATLVLGCAIAYALGSNFDSVMNHGKSGTQIAFGTAAAPPSREEPPSQTPVDTGPKVTYTSPNYSLIPPKPPAV